MFFYVLTWNHSESNLGAPKYQVQIFDHGWKYGESLKYTSKTLKKPRFDLWWGIKEAELQTGVYYVAVQAIDENNWRTKNTGHFRLEVYLDVNSRKFKPCEKPKLFIAKPSIFPELLLCTRGLGVWSNVPKRIKHTINETSSNYEILFRERPPFKIHRLIQLSEQGVATYRIV